MVLPPRAIVALICLVLASSGNIAWAQATPSGLWKTIDDNSHTEQALVRITESGGVLSGRVERFLAPDIEADAICDKCRDDRRNKPVLGLEIIRGVRKSNNAGLWDGGTILDSEDGQVYSVRLQPIEGGRKLEVRGYIGFALFGRTQTWLRVD